MRIAGGVFAGRVLTGPPRADSRRRPLEASERARPTAVRLRKSLFTVLADELAGARVLDVCAGVGTLGFEAMSRGARECVFVERSPRLARLIARNADRLGVTAFALVVGDAVFALRRFQKAGREFGVLFIDPPWEAWESEQGTRLLTEAVGLAPLVVAEHRSSWSPPPRVFGPEGEPGSAARRFAAVRTRTTTAGEGAFSLYRREEQAEEGRTLS